MSLKSWKGFVLECGKIVTLPGGRYTDTKNLTILLSLAAQKKARKILELMTAYGDTAVALATVLPDAEVFTFDVSLEDGGPGTDQGNFNEILPRDQVGSAIRATDSEIAKRIHLTIDNGAKLAPLIRKSGPYDIAFIDGNHTWRYVIEDTRLALETVGDKGILVWDDYVQHAVEVVQVIDMLNYRTGDLIALVQGTRMCYVRLDPDKKARMEKAIADL